MISLLGTSDFLAPKLLLLRAAAPSSSLPSEAWRLRCKSTKHFRAGALSHLPSSPLTLSAHVKAESLASWTVFASRGQATCGLSVERLRTTGRDAVAAVYSLCTWQSCSCRISSSAIVRARSRPGGFVRKQFFACGIVKLTTLPASCKPRSPGWSLGTWRKSSPPRAPPRPHLPPTFGTPPLLLSSPSIGLAGLLLSNLS